MGKGLLHLSKFFGIADRNNDRLDINEDGSLNTALIAESGNPIGVQYPLETDGDAVYIKDIDVANCITTGWTGINGGTVADLFGETSKGLTYTGTDNPKTLTIRFNRTILTTGTFALVTNTGNFSNVKATGIRDDNTEYEIQDSSGDNTDRTLFPIISEPLGFIGMILEFSTADTISLTTVIMPKAVSTLALIRGQKTDGSTDYVGITNGGNFKISLEEFDPAFNTLPLPVLDQMSAIPLGTMIGKSSNNKFGRSPSGVQTTPTDIWDRADSDATQKIWVAPTIPRTHTIASTDADDTTGGNGARTVKIWGLTAWDADEVSETVTMNTGTPPVTGNSYVIIHRMKVITNGGNINEGIITATAIVDGTITAQINIGQGQTQMAIFGVPSTQKVQITCYYGSAHESTNPATPNFVDINLRINESPDTQVADSAFITKHTKGVSTNSNNMTHCFKPYNTIPGPCIIKIQCTSSANDIDFSAGFDVILIDN
jgi:hypothetical protein